MTPPKPKLPEWLVRDYDFHRSYGNSPEDALYIACTEAGVNGRRLHQKLAARAFRELLE